MLKREHRQRRTMLKNDMKQGESSKLTAEDDINLERRRAQPLLPDEIPEAIELIWEAKGLINVYEHYIQQKKDGRRLES